MLSKPLNGLGSRKQQVRRGEGVGFSGHRDMELFKRAENKDRRAWIPHVGKKFLNHIPKESYVREELRKKEMTVFAPTNEAVKQFDERLKREGKDPQKIWDQIYAYHLANYPITSEGMGAITIASSYKGSVPIWVNRRRNGNGDNKESIFLNNAKVVLQDIRGGVRTQNGELRTQVSGRKERGSLNAQVRGRKECGSLNIQVSGRKERGSLNAQVRGRKECGSLNIQVSGRKERGSLNAQVRGRKVCGYLNTQVSGRKEWGSLNAQVRGRKERGSLNGTGVKEEGAGFSGHTVLHIIDDVLEPVFIDSSRGDLYNPSTYKLMEQSGTYKVKLGKVNELVNKHVVKNPFNAEGRNTFFLPSDEGFPGAWNKIDSLVLQGFIVPKVALFTRNFQEGPFTTAIEDVKSDLRVRVEMKNGTDGDGNPVYYAVSTVVQGDNQHSEGTTVGIIKKANIPVRNGVVHIVDKPLMVVDENMEKYLQRDPQLSKFREFLVTSAPEVFRMVRDASKPATLLAPSNKAFDLVDKKRYEKIIQNMNTAKALGNLHLVQGEVTSKSAREGQTKEMTMLPASTMDQNDGEEKVYFHSSGAADNLSLSVDGGGVNSTIAIADINTSNGVIHIIDRILGIPYQSIYEKLSSDPMLKESFNLGEHGNRFNEKFQRMDHQFTYFVPSDEAWVTKEKQFPTAVKKLRSGRHGYHVSINAILERHMFGNGGFTLDELVAKSESQTKEEPLETMRGRVKVSKVGRAYYVEWEGENAEIIRGDIECTNGYIHVIDNVLMKKRDVTTSGGVHFSATLLSLPLSFVSLHIVRRLAQL
ncbi:unnamed protein product [Cyprideis torosa]|uniref:Uncharacterized protein n=1 Tax=Cyprideis torosa TaxID=163714 RepID=A0A7R8ZJG5_9CRUS|nr:unnamed protein product [Cyprideis torosa]CAG0888608.1 unnamed protein product [Cyprideis torosa]